MKKKKETEALSGTKPKLKGYFAKAEKAVKKLGITGEQLDRMEKVFTKPSERKNYRHRHTT